MARPLRIQFPGAFYHVTARGNEQKNIFKSNRDREKFLSYLESAGDRYGVVIHAFCLMDNHYHALIETPEGNLSQIMRHINGAYTTYFNTKRRRAGHLFQGRFKAILVDRDEYATTLSRYIHLNPIRAGIVALPEEYLWSSYQYYVGQKKVPEWLTTDFIYGFFAEKPAVARKRYCQFVNDLVKQEYESPLKDIFASTILGGVEFVKDIQERYLVSVKNDRNLPAMTELSRKKTIEEIRAAIDKEFNNNPSMAKKVALYVCHKYSGGKLKEIGQSFGVGESAVSQASRRLREILVRDKYLRKKITGITKELFLSNV
jgi:REP element-mobilizing transposase RayT